MSILLYMIAIFSILSALAVLGTNNPVFSILFLILVFFFSSLFLLVLGLDFIAFTFLIIYIGAIAVLFLFVIMMLRIVKLKINNRINKSIIVLLFILFLFNYMFIYFNMFSFSENLSIERFYDYNVIKEISMFTINVYAIGLHLYTTYSFIFICCGILLLIGMLGSIILTINYGIDFKKQDDFKQVLSKFNKNIILKINK